MTTAPLTERARTNGSRRDDALSRGLGWDSAALGVPQLIRPGGFARGLGVGMDLACSDGR
jgi:hypothetical protein